MRMEAAVYEDIVRSLRARAWGDLDTMQEEMGREFPAVAAQSIRSILYQEFQRHVKATFRSEHSDANKAAVCSRLEESLDRGDSVGTLARMAAERGASPALTARMVVDTRYYNLDVRDNGSVAAKMKDSTLIEDGRLAAEVFLATIKDDSYGHLAEAIKHSIGEEHEQRIKDELSRLQVPFSDEHLLRSQVSCDWWTPVT